MEIWKFGDILGFVSKFEPHTWMNHMNSCKSQELEETNHIFPSYQDSTFWLKYSHTSNTYRKYLHANLTKILIKWFKSNQVLTFVKWLLGTSHILWMEGSITWEKTENLWMVKGQLCLFPSFMSTVEWLHLSQVTSLFF